jgi:hypothetical protein
MRGNSASNVTLPRVQETPCYVVAERLSWAGSLIGIPFANALRRRTRAA